MSFLFLFTTRKRKKERILIIKPEEILGANSKKGLRRTR